jgi:hypothetical protein
MAVMAVSISPEAAASRSPWYFLSRVKRPTGASGREAGAIFTSKGPEALVVLAGAWAMTKGAAPMARPATTERRRVVFIRRTQPSRIH